MNEEYLNIFHVPIQISKLELNIDSLIEFCYEMKCKDAEGVKLTNVGGWQSDNIFNETHSEFAKLKNKIEEEANLFHHKMQFKKIYNQKLGNIWININQKGHLNDYHHHPQSIFSGAFYLIKTKSSIVFQHSFRDIATYYWVDSIVEEWNPVNSGVWSIEPEPNVLIIFPAWAEHKVIMNEEDTDRISLSFNTVIHETEKGNG